MRPSDSAPIPTATKQIAANAHPRRNASSAAPGAGVPTRITSTATPMTAPTWRMVPVTAEAVA